MAKLLLNLRNVPDDEADEVRQWLQQDGFDFYETRPSPWGISAGGLWLRDDDALPAARERMARYQAQRRSAAQAEQAQAQREGRQDSFVGGLQQRPLYVLGVVAAMLVIVLVTLALPWWLLG